MVQDAVVHAACDVEVVANVAKAVFKVRLMKM